MYWLTKSLFLGRLSKRLVSNKAVGQSVICFVPGCTSSPFISHSPIDSDHCSQKTICDLKRFKIKTYLGTGYPLNHISLYPAPYAARSATPGSQRRYLRGWGYHSAVSGTGEGFPYNRSRGSSH